MQENAHRRAHAGQDSTHFAERPDHAALHGVGDRLNAGDGIVEHQFDALHLGLQPAGKIGSHD
jgi:hypothetical protein